MRLPHRPRLTSLISDKKYLRRLLGVRLGDRSPKPTRGHAKRAYGADRCDLALAVESVFAAKAVPRGET